ncbi:ATP-binding protein (plasmid) [Kovacikia minuta CCNUW1]|uniref:ATP-binding protein n=1 Tax=Kovacikia minuta TaxID=2931930 RepID=UPI001CCBE326|nr:ATP-binding protein [Kovacikia minuta]UBF30545.1 ATP-binding protein [Kovacikia minuta CCNUW1]
MPLSSNVATASIYDPLVQAIAHIRRHLHHHASLSTPHPTPSTPHPTPSTPHPTPHTPHPLHHLCQTFNLSLFERDLLLLCAGVELEADFAPLCAAAQGDPQRPYPTFSLALAALPDAFWGALAPHAPLRRWQLIEVGAGNILTTSPLRINEQILHYLTGNGHLNWQLVERGAIALGQTPLVPSHLHLAEQMANAWYLAFQDDALLPALQLCGKDRTSQRAIAVAACNRLNLSPYAISVESLPTDLTALNQVKGWWERDALLNGVALLLEWDEAEIQEPKQQMAIAQFIEQTSAPLILLNQTRRCQKHRPLVTFDVSSPTTEEQQLLWENSLREIAPNLNGHIENLVSHFNFSAPAIRATSLKLQSLEPDRQPSPQTVQAQLWAMCRTQARPRLDELAQRIDSSAEWNDLVLPDSERQVLQDIATQLKQRPKVYQQWGFGSKSKRGLGISALFAGASGTGKTMAAEVLAKALQLDLYRIDLSAVVSKYIGETEKNLGRVFDAAEVSGVILLFDEADSLFGKRSDVKDSHDRYANMEVSYLLQRMEAYRGLAILTTNLKGAIDQAFLRRIRFIVQFPFPDASQRAEIWRRVFPQQTPTEGLDKVKLAKLNVTGGNIRSIALNAAFIAADANQPIRMEHILKAARSEYTKLERPLTDAETKGWV